MSSQAAQAVAGRWAAPGGAAAPSAPAMPAAVGRWGISGLPAVLAGLTLLLLSALWAVAVMQAGRDRETAEAAARRQVTNLARAFAEHSAKTIEGADQAIRFVRREYLRKGAAIDLADYVTRQDVIDTAYHQIAIIGADGWMVQSSLPGPTVYLGDREHFRVHRDAPGADRLFVSKPVLGRMSKKWSLQLTRRIDAPDGRFLGVVVLSLSPEYLTRFYGDVDLGSAGLVALVGRDGIVRARQSGAHDVGGQDISRGGVFVAALRQPSGVVWSSSPVDATRRILAFRGLAAYDLIVIVGRGEGDVFAESDAARRAYLAAAGVVSLLLTTLMAVIVMKARQQVQLLRELVQSNARAQAANELKSRFLASVSHELRTPLNGIIGYAELVQHAAQDAETREYGEVIQKSGEHLHALVNTILDLAKIESGQLRLHVEPVAVREALAEVRSMHLVPAQASGLALELNVRPTCIDVVRIDRMRFKQVVGNLVHNAVKFTESGGVRIDACSDATQLVVEVTDTGPGIEPSLRDRLFTRFHAVTAAFTHPMQGAGLGLPLARELAEAMGGSLELDAAHAPGTRIVLRLPLDAPPHEPSTDTP